MNGKTMLQSLITAWYRYQCNRGNHTPLYLKSRPGYLGGIFGSWVCRHCGYEFPGFPSPFTKDNQP